MTRLLSQLVICFVLTLPSNVLAQKLALSDVPTAEDQAALEALILRAEEAAGAGKSDYDTAIYYATLESGLMRLSGQAGAEARGADYTQLDPASITVSEEAINRIANDTARQEGLDQIVDRVRAGLRVIGGQTARPGQFTSAVALIAANNNAGCSGVVIAPGWILTAAHCYCDFGLDQGRIVHVRFANPAVTQSTSASFVLNGEMMDDDFCTRRETGTICSPDLALLRYAAAETPEFVIPARIAPAADAAAHVAVGGIRGSIIVGFGATRPDGAASGTPWNPLQTNPKTWGLIPQVQQCNPTLACTSGTDQRGCTPEQDIVMMDTTARSPGDVTDACYGDSGGPVYLPKSATDNPRIFALTSRAADRHGRCGHGTIYPKIYTTEVRDWIVEAQRRLNP